MIEFTTGNLLQSESEALINTVNTVGVMGKGIALMFKEAFPANFKAYAAACKRGEVHVGKMFITEGPRLANGPAWIINFPTKKHWRSKTDINWIQDGLDDLVRVVRELGIRSIALPPLGCGNGGLEWGQVKPIIIDKLATLEGVSIAIFEPGEQYQNVMKRDGIKKLTPARALVAEIIRRYGVLGIECTLLEVQKLAWFLERRAEAAGLQDLLDLRFQANRYGPYADRLRHLLNQLDGSYLKSEVRIPDAKPLSKVAFDESKRATIETYLNSEAVAYKQILDEVSQTIDGFESPLGMELLATVDWLLAREGVEPSLASVKAGLSSWKGGGQKAAERRLKLFDDRLLAFAIDRLQETTWSEPSILGPAQ